MTDFHVPESPGAEEETRLSIGGGFLVLAAFCVGMAWGAFLALSIQPTPIVTECHEPPNERPSQ